MSFVSEFQGYVNQALGFARPTRYQFTIAIDNLIKGSYSSGASDVVTSNNNIFNLLGFKNGRYAQRLRFFCNAFRLPGFEFLTAERDAGGRPRYVVPNVRIHEPFVAVFYVGQDMLERAFFDAWQGCIMNPKSQDLNFFEEYTADIDIHQMGDISPIPPLPGKAGDIQRIFNQGMDLAGDFAGFVPGGMQVVDKVANFSQNPFSALGSKNPVTKKLNKVFGSSYVMHVERAWPLMIHPMEYGANHLDQIHTIQVVFAYKRIYNPDTIDPNEYTNSRGSDVGDDGPPEQTVFDPIDPNTGQAITYDPALLEES